MLTNIFTWVQSKTRLITEYLLLGLLVSVGGLAYSFYLTRSEVREDLTNAHEKITHLETSLSVQAAANEMNAEAIKSLNDFRELDSTAIDGLLSLLQNINKERTAQDLRLKNLEKDNAEVTPYLNTFVPAGYDCVLEPETCATPAPTPSGKQGPVSAAKPNTPETVR